MKKQPWINTIALSILSVAVIALHLVSFFQYQKNETVMQKVNEIEEKYNLLSEAYEGIELDLKRNTELIQYEKITNRILYNIEFTLANSDSSRKTGRYYAVYINALSMDDARVFDDIGNEYRFYIDASTGESWMSTTFYAAEEHAEIIKKDFSTMYAEGSKFVGPYYLDATSREVVENVIARFDE
jgi:hypothetical protein